LFQLYPRLRLAGPSEISAIIKEVLRRTCFDPVLKPPGVLGNLSQNLLSSTFVLALQKLVGLVLLSHSNQITRHAAVSWLPQRRL
jgi:hypothetical protein